MNRLHRIVVRGRDDETRDRSVRDNYIHINHMTIVESRSKNNKILHKLSRSATSDDDIERSEDSVSGSSIL